MRVLVTGAAGLLGSAVVEALTASGREVLATDIVYNAQRLGGFKGRFEPADLLDGVGCYRLVQGCDAVVHLGNHRSQHARFPPQTLYAENCAMTANVFVAAMDSGVRQVVYASSVQVMMGRDRCELDEELRPLSPFASELPYLPIDGRIPTNPENTYGSSKLAGEALLKLLCLKSPGFSGCAVRFPALHDMKWIERAKTLPKWRRWHRSVYPDEGFGYLWVPDAAALVDAILTHPAPGYACYAPAHEDNLLALSAEELIERFYPDVPLKQSLAGRQSVIDIREITEQTGWTPKGPLLCDLLAEPESEAEVESPSR